MSFGGILATALAGGAGVIGKQAGDDIEAGRKSALMREQADIEEQMRMRLMERQESQRRSGVLWETDGDGGEAKSRARGRELAQSSDAAIAQAKGMIPVAVEQATAVEGAKRDATTTAGNDPKYIKALKAISQASAAPDRTDYKGRELDNAVKQMTVDNAKRAQDLRAEFGKAAPERQQQIKDELSVLTGKDTDKFVPVPLKDEAGNITGYQVFDTKSGRFVDGGKGGDDPILANLKAQRAAAEGAKKDKPAAAPMIQSGAQPAGAANRYKLISDGSGRMVDLTTGRTLSQEQSDILQKIQRGEPTSPRERAILKD